MDAFIETFIDRLREIQSREENLQFKFDRDDTIASFFCCGKLLTAFPYRDLAQISTFYK